MTLPERIAVAADDAQPLVTRALATWFASGVNGGGQKTVGRGDLVGLLRSFSKFGMPDPLQKSVVSGVHITREPIVIMVPLLAAAMHQAREKTSNSERAVTDAPAWRGILVCPLESGPS